MIYMYVHTDTHTHTLNFSKGRNKLCRDLSKWTNNKNLIEGRTILETILNFTVFFTQLSQPWEPLFWRNSVGPRWDLKISIFNNLEVYYFQDDGHLGATPGCGRVQSPDPDPRSRKVYFKLLLRIMLWGLIAVRQVSSSFPSPSIAPFILCIYWKPAFGLLRKKMGLIDN